MGVSRAFGFAFAIKFGALAFVVVDQFLEKLFHRHARIHEYAAQQGLNFGLTVRAGDALFLSRVDKAVDQATGVIGIAPQVSAIVDGFCDVARDDALIAQVVIGKVANHDPLELELFLLVEAGGQVGPVGEHRRIRAQERLVQVPDDQVMDLAPLRHLLRGKLRNVVIGHGLRPLQTLLPMSADGK